MAVYKLIPGLLANIYAHLGFIFGTTSLEENIEVAISELKLKLRKKPALRTSR